MILLYAKQKDQTDVGQVLRDFRFKNMRCYCRFHTDCLLKKYKMTNIIFKHTVLMEKCSKNEMEVGKLRIISLTKNALYDIIRLGVFLISIY